MTIDIKFYDKITFRNVRVSGIIVIKPEQKSLRYETKSMVDV